MQRIRTVQRRLVARSYFIAASFGLRSWVRALRKESSESGERSRQPYVLSMRSIWRVCAGPPRRFGVGLRFETERSLNVLELDHAADAELIAVKIGVLD